MGLAGVDSSGGAVAVAGGCVMVVCLEFGSGLGVAGGPNHFVNIDMDDSCDELFNRLCLQFVDITMVGCGFGVRCWFCHSGILGVSPCWGSCCCCWGGCND